MSLCLAVSLPPGLVNVTRSTATAALLMKTIAKTGATNKNLKIKFGKFLVIIPHHKLYPEHRRSKKCRHLILYMKKYVFLGFLII